MRVPGSFYLCRAFSAALSLSVRFFITALSLLVVITSVVRVFQAILLQMKWSMRACLAQKCVCVCVCDFLDIIQHQTMSTRSSQDSRT